MDETTRVSFFLDDRSITVNSQDTILQIAGREGIDLPHLCRHQTDFDNGKDVPGNASRAGVGSCRLCLVEISGETSLAAACMRKPQEGEKVYTGSIRARKIRQRVLELHLSTMPARGDAPDTDNEFWKLVDRLSAQPRFGTAQKLPIAAEHDASHAHFAVNMNACIGCGLCVSACRDIQVNDIIAMGYRANHLRPVFDLDVPLGDSGCVSCGQCAQACPTGAILAKSIMNSDYRQKAVSPDRRIEATCPHCALGCATSIAAANHHITQIEGRGGTGSRGRLCARGRFYHQWQDATKRLHEPVIRREDVAKSASMQAEMIELDEIFTPVSWDEALDRAGLGLMRIANEYGSSSIAALGSARLSNEEAYLFQKLVREGFRSQHLDFCNRASHMPPLQTLAKTSRYFENKIKYEDCLNADCIVIFGAHPDENHPVAASFIKQALRRGAQLIIIDPYQQNLDHSAGLQLNFLPGTDGALLSALIHTIIEENLYSSSTIDNNWDALELLGRRVADYSPESVAEFCGVRAEGLRKAARIYAKADHAIIFCGSGASQGLTSVQETENLVILTQICNHQRRHSGIYRLGGQANLFGVAMAGLMPGYLPDFWPVKGDDSNGAKEGRMGNCRSVPEIFQAIGNGKIRALYCVGANPAISCPDQLAVREALSRLDQLVVQDISFSATAIHADILLPSTTFYEKTGSYTNANWEIRLSNQAIDPPFAARADWEIMVQIAKRFGLAGTLSNIEALYDEMRSHIAVLRDVSWEALKAGEAVDYVLPELQEASLIPDASNSSENASPYIPHWSERLLTRSKIVETPDFLSLPEPPDEIFPFILTCGRTDVDIGALSPNIDPPPIIDKDYAQLNSRDIERLNLTAGQLVTITTRRGAITTKLLCDDLLADNIIFMPITPKNGKINRLMPARYSRLEKTAEMKFAAARIEHIASLS